MRRVAVLTDRRGSSAFVSPFFEMAPWILVVDTAQPDRLRWIRNADRDRSRCRSRIVASDVDALLCGWIDRLSVEHLIGASVSVFIAPCNEPAVDLATELTARLPTPFAVFENLERGRD